MAPVDPDQGTGHPFGRAAGQPQRGPGEVGGLARPALEALAAARALWDRPPGLSGVTVGLVGRQVEPAAGQAAGARVLDLYAGSGAVGLEALSRGAEHVLLVESGARAARVIRANIEAIGLPGAEVVTDRVERVLARGPALSVNEGRYDVVFADPPYAQPDQEVSGVLVTLADRGWLAPGALVIVERATRSGPVSWPAGFTADRARRYGEATFWYARGASDLSHLPAEH